MENQRRFTWLPLVTGTFITTLLISNIIAVKLVHIFGLVLPAAVVLFPVTYIVGDVLTEVYGYAQARQVIWIGFTCNLLAVTAIWIAGALPAASYWTTTAFQSPDRAQQAYQAILGFAPRLLLASFMAYLIGEFLNSFILAKLKLVTKGRYLWIRTIGSTIVGEGADSVIFITVAFFGVLPAGTIVATIMSQWLFKVVYETLATPLTYLVVGALKRAEHVDYYDFQTDFSPLGFKTENPQSL